MIKEYNTSSHDITIRGFAIDGNREGNTNVVSGKGYYNLIHLRDCQNISVCNMYLTNNHGDGFPVSRRYHARPYDRKCLLRELFSAIPVCGK